jgi:hypothetical protein
MKDNPRTVHRDSELMNLHFPSQSHSPKALVVSVLPYLFSARVVLGLREVGFLVAIVSPKRHPIHRLRHPARYFPLGIAGANSLGPFGARTRIASAIEDFAPDVVIACDDQATILLHSAALAAQAPVRRVIEKSLGPAKAYQVLESRTRQVKLAASFGIRTPPFAEVTSVASLSRAIQDLAVPAFLKRDTTWAGQGVKRITDERDGQRVWHELSRSHSVFAALKNIPVTGWRYAMAGLRRERPLIHLQTEIHGMPANRTVICKDGKVLGGLSLVALQTSSSTGPASVLRIAREEEMSRAADALARDLELSGFVGFDFVIPDRGEIYFLEINARATPACSLVMPDSPDLLGVLFEAVTGNPCRSSRLPKSDTVALFPDEMLRDKASDFLRTAYHDVPADEPGLVDFGMEQVELNGAVTRAIGEKA